MLLTQSVSFFDTAGENFYHGFMPVSYTHLDVYKRQVFNYLVRMFYFFPMIVAPVYIAVIWSNILAADGGLLNYYIQKIGFDAVGWLTDRRVALKTIVGIEVWRLTGFAMLTFIAGIKNISCLLYTSICL